MRSRPARKHVNYVHTTDYTLEYLNTSTRNVVLCMFEREKDTTDRRKHTKERQTYNLNYTHLTTNLDKQIERTATRKI